MSYDLAVWYPNRLLADEEALEQYTRLCNEDISGLEAHLAIDAFYNEIVNIHPEVDDVPEDKIGDFGFSPWSNEHHRSNCHIIMSCVWSHANHVHDLVFRLGKKYGLAIFDPQLSKIYYPSGYPEKN